MLTHLKHGYIRFGCTKELNLLAELGRVQNFPFVVGWVGLGRVTQNGPMDNSENDAVWGGDARNHALDEGAHWRHLANTILIVPCAPAMRPCIILFAQWPRATNTDTVWRQKYNLLFDNRRAVLS